MSAEPLLSEPTRVTAQILRPVRWDRMRADEAERIVRTRAKQSFNVTIGEHAFERVDGRSIVLADVYRILRAGQIDGLPERVARADGSAAWKVVMARRMPGAREAGAVTLFLEGDDQLFVKTVMWMDPAR